ASWDGVAEPLSCTRPVVALDLVGHGGSDRPEGAAAYTLEAQGEMLLAFLASALGEAGPAAPGGPDGRFAALMQGCRKPVVVGYSMGGRVALAAACRHPEAFARRVGGLVLESAGLGPVDEHERKDAAERDARNAAALRRDGLSAFMDAWERLPLFATQRDLPASTCERVRAGRLANDAEALARTFEHAGQHAMPSRGDVLAALASLRDSGVPVRYIAGARDVKYRALAEDLEEEGLCEVRVVAGAGHNVHLEEPAAYLRALEGFPG
ncbi:alpha/beta fold hydrolase, partial [Gordonibacter pamelaeae]